MKYLLKITSFFFIIVTFTSNSYGHFGDYFYYDILVTDNDQKILNEVIKDAERKIEEYVFLKGAFGYLSKEDVSEIVHRKKTDVIPNSDSIRIYIQFNSTYDTLKIIGLSQLFRNKIEYFMIPLISFETNLKTKDYKLLDDLVIKKSNEYFQQASFKKFSFDFKRSYSFLNSSFYLFTCAEVYLFEEPFNKNSEIKNRWEAHDYISKNQTIDISYYDFPNPQYIYFALKTSSLKDTIPPTSDYLNFKAISNTNIVIDYEYIGLSFDINNVNRTFWAETDYIESYLKDFNQFQTAIRFFYMTSIRDNLSPANSY